MPRQERAGPPGREGGRAREGGAGGSGSCCGAGRSSAFPQVRGAGPRAVGPGELVAGGSEGARREVPGGRCPVCAGCPGAVPTPGPPPGRQGGLGSLWWRCGGGTDTRNLSLRNSSCPELLWGEGAVSVPLRCKQIKINLLLCIIFLCVYIYLLYNT